MKGFVSIIDILPQFANWIALLRGSSTATQIPKRSLLESESLPIWSKAEESGRAYYSTDVPV